MNRIYLDYAATTPVDKDVLEAMLPYFGEKFGNPSSVHSFGQDAQSAVDQARSHIADFLGCLSQEIVFTGSATEANNLAILGSAASALSVSQKAHIITTRIEHESVLEPIKQLAKTNPNVSVTYLPVSRDGFVSAEAVRDALTPETALVSVMYANNEIGTIQPIKEIAEVVREHNEKLKAKSYKLKTVFHTDAVQAALYCPMKVADLGVDMLTLSGHKIYGPKGVGALYVKKGTVVSPVIFGSGQEYGKRSGTENVPGIVGIGAAVEAIDRSAGESIEKLRDYFIDETLNQISTYSLNGGRQSRLPNNANILFRGVSSVDLIMRLDAEGIAVSSGAACQSKAVAASHVLAALGLSVKDASSSIRFSLGKNTTKKDIDKALAALLKLTHT